MGAKNDFRRTTSGRLCSPHEKPQVIVKPLRAFLHRPKKRAGSMDQVDWKGTWRNQYGSSVTITDDHGGFIRGTFITALEDSGFFGKTVPIYGAASGDVIGFSSAARTDAGPAAVSYTGIFRDGKLEMLWHMVAGTALSADGVGAPAKLVEHRTWKAFRTGLDTFTRED
jgi:hypothetical protein